MPARRARFRSWLPLVASSVVLLGVATPAHAERIVTVIWNAAFDSGSLSRTVFPIFISYDADQVSSDGATTLPLGSFDFSLNGVAFSRDLATSPPEGIFRAGNLIALNATFGNQFGTQMPTGSPVRNIWFRNIDGSPRVSYTDLSGGTGVGSSAPARRYRVTGVVTDDEGTPISGSRLYLDLRFTLYAGKQMILETDATGAYSFEAVLMIDPVVAFGWVDDPSCRWPAAPGECQHESDVRYIWAPATTADEVVDIIQNFHLHRILRIAVGESVVVTVNPDDAICYNDIQDSHPWPEEFVCRTVRFAIPYDGTLTVRAVPVDPAQALPPIEVQALYTNGPEALANPVVLPGVPAGAEYMANVEIPYGSGASQSFVLYTSMDPPPAPNPSPLPAPISSPYGNTPASVPGIVQAENFDSGGQDVAYRDADEPNSGGQYRLDTGVDIEITSDTGDGANVGWMAAGEWLQYTVDVTSGGSYTIEARVAANGPGGTFHIELNGSDVTGSLVIPNTYGWQNWTSVSRASVSLPAGRQVLRVVLDANGPTGVFGNLNYLRFTGAANSGSIPHDGIAAVIPGVVQAENFDDGGEGLAYHDADVTNSGAQYRDSGVDIEVTSDTGDGANVGWMTAGEWLQYTIDVTSGGSYIIEARVAANGPGGTFHIEVNGSDVTGPLLIPNTGGWQSWTTVSRGVSLQAGRRTLRVVLDANGPTGVFGNLNYLRVSPINADAYEVTGIVTDDQGKPLAGAVVTMAYWLGATTQFPTAVTDASGVYRISFIAALSGNQFVARAQVLAEGYDEYWRSLSRSGTSFVEDFRLTRITRITAGDSTVLSVPIDVGECIGWVAQACPVVRVMVPTPGNLTIEVAATDQNAEMPLLEVCCVDGDERYGNPITVAVPAGETWVMVGMDPDVTITRSFVVKTSLEPF